MDNPSSGVNKGPLVAKKVVGYGDVQLNNIFLSKENTFEWTSLRTDMENLLIWSEKKNEASYIQYMDALLRVTATNLIIRISSDYFEILLETLSMR